MTFQAPLNVDGLAAGEIDRPRGKVECTGYAKRLSITTPAEVLYGDDTDPTLV